MIKKSSTTSSKESGAYLKLFFFIIIISACLFYIGCAATSNSSFQNSADYHNKTDSLFAEYQKQSFNQKRTFSYLNPVLDSLEISIGQVLNEPQFKPKVIFRTLLLYILPSGRFRLSNFGGFLKPDSITANDPELIKAYYKPDSLLKIKLDTTASNFKTDSLPDYNQHFCIPGKINETSLGFSFEFRDSCYYTSGLTGGRSKASIMKVVVSEIYRLKDAYNDRLRSGQRYSGKIIVKFAINDRGHIIFAEIVPSGTTIADEYLCTEFIRIINSWRFGRINKPGDVTEVVYPFILSQ